MNKTIYVIDISAEGYERTFFEDYATALDYYNKLKGMGLNPELEERVLTHDYDNQ